MNKVLPISLILSMQLMANSELELLKSELERQKSVVEKLEKKLETLEKKEYKSELKLNNIESKTNKMLPDISLIVDGSFVSRDIKDSQYKALEIPAFTHSHAEGDSHGHSHEGMHSKEGFNLNYAELSLNSAVDPYFELFSTFHITNESFEIEEAYFKSKIFNGVGLKGGKFLSSFGRVNSQHLHYQDFADTPLVYQALLGSHGILEKGLSIDYTFNLPIYLNVGVESLMGENEQSYGIDGFDVLTESVKESNRPNLMVFYVKSSFDLDDKSTVLIGASYATGESKINHLEEEDEPHAFSGDSDIYGVDFTYKRYFDTHNYIKLQSEYLYRELDGIKYSVTEDVLKKANLLKKQGGYYVEGIYAFDKNHRVGYRYENLDKNDIFANSKKQLNIDGLDKQSIMYDYSLSEFSKIRVQYDFDSSKYIEDEKMDFKQLTVQFNMLIGSHAAHSF